MIPQLYETYAQDISRTLEDISWSRVHDMVEALHEARLRARRIFVMGNGGSASTASHMACDLNKNTAAPDLPRFKVMACTDNVATLTAYANDDGYESVFAEQLRNFLQPHDIVVAISTSGNSPNVLRAVELANTLGAYTIGWTGHHGGQLGALVDLWINVPSDCIEQIEDIHLILEHMVTLALRETARGARDRALPMGFSLAHASAD